MSANEIVSCSVKVRATAKESPRFNPASAFSRMYDIQTMPQFATGLEYSACFRDYAFAAFFRAAHLAFARTDRRFFVAGDIGL
jgi:hypothetical protein